MRIAIVLCTLLAGCVPQGVINLAGTRLHTGGKHLHLASHDRMDGSDVYVFCRSEHRGSLPGPFADRHYDGACIVLVCPAGDDGKHCDGWNG